jgi:two-component system chemotaxis sensor kinase CheA
MDELTREFLIESQEGLDRMERCLTELEVRPGDSGLLAEIFRAVHTIKGTTGFLGFRRLETLAHTGENLLGLLRGGKVAADRRVITGLLELLDGLRLILKGIEADGSEGDGSDAELIEKLGWLQTHRRVEAGPVPSPVRSDETPGRLESPKGAGTSAAESTLGWTSRCSTG